MLTGKKEPVEVEQYLEQLDNTEKKILVIAEIQLGSSFDISKSIGFLKWKENIML